MLFLILHVELRFDCISEAPSSVVEALIGLELIDEVVQLFVEFFDYFMVLLKDIEDVGCSLRDLAKKLGHKIVPH